jgi:hypothetical protein
VRQHASLQHAQRAAPARRCALRTHSTLPYCPCVAQTAFSRTHDTRSRHAAAPACRFRRPLQRSHLARRLGLARRPGRVAAAANLSASVLFSLRHLPAEVALDLGFLMSRVVRNPAGPEATRRPSRRRGAPTTSWTLSTPPRRKGLDCLFVGQTTPAIALRTTPPSRVDRAARSTERLIVKRLMVSLYTKSQQITGRGPGAAPRAPHGRRQKHTASQRGATRRLTRACAPYPPRARSRRASAPTRVRPAPAAAPSQRR